MENREQSDRSELTFRRASESEAGQIARLTNSAYRGDSSRAGWTTEADLLDGQRTDEAQVAALIKRDDSIILLCLDQGWLIGSVNIQRKDNVGYLGMLVVDPKLQGRGIGKDLIRIAETTASEQWNLTKMMMTVISIRPELIAFYERRGYRQTDEIRPFPQDPAGGIPRVEGLQLQVLEKQLLH